jgi:hypothetical protein
MKEKNRLPNMISAEVRADENIVFSYNRMLFRKYAKLMRYPSIFSLIACLIEMLINQTCYTSILIACIFIYIIYMTFHTASKNKLFEKQIIVELLNETIMKVAQSYTPNTILVDAYYELIENENEPSERILYVTLSNGVEIKYSINEVSDYDKIRTLEIDTHHKIVKQ